MTGRTIACSGWRCNDSGGRLRPGRPSLPPSQSRRLLVSAYPPGRGRTDQEEKCPTSNVERRRRLPTSTLDVRCSEFDVRAFSYKPSHPPPPPLPLCGPRWLDVAPAESHIRGAGEGGSHTEAGGPPRRRAAVQQRGQWVDAERKGRRPGNGKGFSCYACGLPVPCCEYPLCRGRRRGCCPQGAGAIAARRGAVWTGSPWPHAKRLNVARADSSAREAIS